jgi:hypothetical protein
MGAHQRNFMGGSLFVSEGADLGGLGVEQSEATGTIFDCQGADCSRGWRTMPVSV